MFNIYVGEKRDQVFHCKEGEDILSAARKNAVKITRGCCSGGCGVCKIKIEEGQFHRGTSSQAVLTSDEREHNYSLACKTYPISDLKIVVAG